MVLVQRLKTHFGIEPSQIFLDKDIKEISNLKELKKYNVLLSVYRNWLGKSYIGYSFFKEINNRLEKEID